MNSYDIRRETYYQLSRGPGVFAGYHADAINNMKNAQTIREMEHWRALAMDAEFHLEAYRGHGRFPGY